MNKTPVFPYFAPRQESASPRVVAEKPIGPLEGVDTVQAVDERLMSILERHALENSGQLAWLPWWKRLLAYDDKVRIDEWA